MGTWFKLFKNIIYSSSVNFNKSIKYKTKSHKGDSVDYILKTGVGGFRSYERIKGKQIGLLLEVLRHIRSGFGKDIHGRMS